MAPNPTAPNTTTHPTIPKFNCPAPPVVFAGAVVPVVVGKDTDPVGVSVGVNVVPAVEASKDFLISASPV